MFNIQLFNKISDTGLSLLSTENYTISEEFTDYDAVLVRSAKLHDVDFPKGLKCIARAGAGVNNIPVEKCAEKGIVVFNTPGANANAVKELVICGLLMSSRRIVDGINWVKTLQGEGAEVAPLVEKGKSAFIGPEIEGKKLGIIGLGAIGVRLANAAVGLGMEVLGHDPYISVDAAWGMSRAVRHAKTLKEIFEVCDYISIHVPLTKETKEMINTESLATMKDGVRILNFSRGDLVNNAAIIAALDTAKVSAYVTDFPTEELLDVSGVIALPHIGASTPESEDNCAIMAAAQVRDYLENGNIKNSVNFPYIALPREAAVRLCIFNKNIPNMVGLITTALAEAGVNIENMANRSKGDFAYTIVETNTPISECILKKIGDISGVISLRIIA